LTIGYKPIFLSFHIAVNLYVQICFHEQFDIYAVKIITFRYDYNYGGKTVDFEAMPWRLNPVKFFLSEKLLSCFILAISFRKDKILETQFFLNLIVQFFLIFRIMKNHR